MLRSVYFTHNNLMVNIWTLH